MHRQIDLRGGGKRCGVQGKRKIETKSQKVEKGNSPKIRMRKARKKTFTNREETATASFTMSVWDKTHPATSNKSNSLEKAQIP